MGIGWTVAHRAVVLGGDIVCGSGDSKSTADAVVADGPAVFRRLMLRPQTAVTVARTFVRQLVARAPSRSLDGVVVSILFDDAAKMPPQRALVAASRARANPADPAGARLDPHTLTPGHLAMVLNWEPLLAHSGSKKAVWELLGRAVFEQLCGHDGCVAEVVTAGAAYVRDNDGVLPTRTPTMHGEADLLVATRAAELATVGRAVEIVTVDYDQVLQALVAPPLTSGPSVLRFRAETIDVAQLVAAYGGECRSRRLSAAFFMLCAFRSDYSKSLCRPTGSRVAAFATAMADGVVAVAERTDAATGARTLTFRPPSFLGVIKAWPQGVGHQMTTAMLEAVLWTLAYFAGYDAFRPAWGGPPCIQLEPAGFAGSASMADVVIAVAESGNDISGPLIMGSHKSGGWLHPRFSSTVCAGRCPESGKPSCADVCEAILACAQADWTKRAAGPGKPYDSVLTHKGILRDDVRRAIVGHPPVALAAFTKLAESLSMMNPKDFSKSSEPHRAMTKVNPDDHREVAAAVIDFFVSSKHGKIKLLQNRLLAQENLKKQKKKVATADLETGEVQRKASAALMLKTVRWQGDMLRVHLRLESAAARRTAGRLPAFAHEAVLPSTAVTGTGTPTLAVVRRDPTAGIAGYRSELFTAPPGMAWLASDGDIAVACSGDAVTVCVLPWRGDAAVPVATTNQLEGGSLPPIATAAIANGVIFYSYFGVICRSMFGPRYEGATSLSRTVMELPGTSTIVMLHSGHTAFCVNTQFGAAWPMAQLPGARRVAVVSWDPETPINSDEKSARRTGRYCRPSGLAKSTFKINDSLPAGLRSGTPIPAVQCGETMVACQLGSVVYLVHVPFIGVGTVPAEWCLEPWGSVDGTLLAVYVTEDEHIRLATTTSVYDTDAARVDVELEPCTSAAWFGPETLVRDGVVTGVELPADTSTPKRARIE